MRLRDPVLEAQRLLNKTPAPASAADDEVASVPYVPAVRLKRAETDALDMMRDHPAILTSKPLILVDSREEHDQNRRAGRRASPIDPTTFLELEVAKDLQRFRDHPFFLDTSRFERSERFSKGPSMALEVVLRAPPFFDEALRAAVTPVFSGSIDAKRLLPLREILDQNGAAIRFRATAVGPDLEDSLEALSLDKRRADLIIDLEHVSDSTKYEEGGDLAKKLVETAAGDWRSVTILAGSYNNSIKTSGAYPRLCWDAYKKLRAAFVRAGQAAPGFGDYGIVNADAEPASGSGGGGGHYPIIRYCRADSWSVLKHSDHPALDYFGLARLCAAADYFMGAEFSPGDAFIERCATAQASSSGAQVQWLAADLSHQWAFAWSQCSRQPLQPKPVPPERIRDRPTPLRMEDMCDRLI
jgi:hypothetical protein